MTMRPLTRRRLLQLGGAAGLTAALPLRVSPAHARTSWLRRSTYAGRTGEAFKATLRDGRTLSLRLLDVSDLQGLTAAGGKLAGRDDAFCLSFRSTSSWRLPQGTYRLSHPQLGGAELFLVPGARGDGQAAYAAVIHRADR
jgi:hypothetical protein